MSFYGGGVGGRGGVEKVGGWVSPPTASGYVHQKCIPVVLGYKEAR